MNANKYGTWQERILANKPKPITNADHIRSMTDEELAEMMVYKDCPTIEMSLLNCPEKYCHDGESNDCHQCWLDWLKQEAITDG